MTTRKPDTGLVKPYRPASNGGEMITTTISPDWPPITTIPADMLDGREVLLWAGRLTIGSWCDGWCDAVGRPLVGVTHWAEVEGPGV